MSRLTDLGEILDSYEGRIHIEQDKDFVEFADYDSLCNVLCRDENFRLGYLKGHVREDGGLYIDSVYIPRQKTGVTGTRVDHLLGIPHVQGNKKILGVILYAPAAVSEEQCKDFLNKEGYQHMPLRMIINEERKKIMWEYPELVEK